MYSHGSPGMGTKVQIESGFPGYFSMRDLNEDSNSCSWPLYYGDRTFTNGLYYNGFFPNSSYEKDLVKRTMLEHEAIFKNQLCELHRLYRIQRDLMDEAKRKETSKLSSSPLASQITSHSPLSSVKKGSSLQASPLLSKNGGTSKDADLFESRPSKVRRKMFDLHLPADVYIDTEGEEQQMDASGTESCLKSKSNLADLNEPVEVEDTNTSSNNYEIEELELGVKPKSEFLGFPQQATVSSHKDRSNGVINDLYLQKNDNKKSWFPNGPSSSETVQVLLNKNSEPATLFLTNQTKASIPSPFRVDSSSELSKTWSYSVSSWEKVNGSCNQKSMAVQMHPCLNSSATLSRSSQSSSQSHGGVRNNWNPRTQRDLPEKNGFYHGSSSGSKELLIGFPSANCDFFNSHHSSKLYKSSNCLELKGANQLNLVAEHRNSSQKRPVVIDLERIQDDDDDDDDDDVTLPWLRTKPNCKKESSCTGVDLNADASSLNLSSDNRLILQNSKSDTDSGRVGEIDSSSCKKILGFSILENDRKSLLLDINLPCDQEAADTEIRVACQIDLNSCITEDESGITPSVAGSNVKAILGIDLEVPAVPEDEEDINPGQECTERAILELSLQDEFIKTAAEAIVAISSSGNVIHQDEIMSEASMTDPLQWFVEVISSFGEDLENKSDENSRNNDGYSLEDYFECMTLRLRETKEEDYMPKPLVPENLVLPEAKTSLLTTRTRRGNARRGRQRKDFQRDILPGLVSLSRHEVTEDLQAFGGMMKAAGHFWDSGLTRRNGCGRGRRRSLIKASPPATTTSPPPPPPPHLVEQLNNEEVGVEDRNLTGWGKTTRRPRRQRCPPGNLSALPLT